MQELAKEEGEESEVKLRGERLLWSTDIRFWIRVRFRAVSVGGNQFKCSYLFFFLITCAKHTGLVAAGVRL